MLRLDAEYARHRFVARLPFRLSGEGTRVSSAIYRRPELPLYGSERCLRLRDVIVDSTKDPPYAFLLHEVPGLACVSCIWFGTAAESPTHGRRRVARPEYANHPTLQRDFMDRRRRGDRRWNGTQRTLCSTISGALASPGLMRYESLLNDPDISLQQVLALGSTGAQSLALTQSESRSARRVRIVAAPHSRRQPNPLRARESYDSAPMTNGEEQMKRRHRLLVTR